MPETKIDENWLGQQIAEVWGHYGAHLDIYNEALRRAKRWARLDAAITDFFGKCAYESTKAHGNLWNMAWGDASAYLARVIDQGPAVTRGSDFVPGSEGVGAATRKGAGGLAVGEGGEEPLESRKATSYAANQAIATPGNSDPARDVESKATEGP